MSQRSSSSRLSGVGDSLFEARFDQENKKQFVARLDQSAFENLQKPAPLKIRFCSEFDPKSAQALRSVTQACVESALGYGLELNHLLPPVDFYSAPDWEAYAQETAPSELPAARLIHQNGQPLVEIITSTKIKSTDGVIKAVRLICAKVFGELFFREKVENRPPFCLIPGELDEISFDLNEKVLFVKFLEVFSKPMTKAFEQEARTQGFRGPKARQRGQNELFRLLLESPEERRPFFKLVESSFDQQVQGLQSDPEQFFDQLLVRVDQQLGQGTLILPHERAHFDFFRVHRHWNFFHALEDRLRFISGYIRELEEAFLWLEQVEDHHADFDPDLAAAWRRTFKERNGQLRKRGWIKLFLMDQALLNKRQQGDKERFPLWLWQRGLLDSLNKGGQVKGMIRQLTDQYRHSVYAKLYECSFRLEQQIKPIHVGGLPFSLDQAPRLKSLRASLNLLRANVDELLNCSRVAFRLSVLVQPRKINKQQVLTSYQEGWSYFISFALIHQFYLSQKSPNAVKFLGAIESYTAEQVEEDASYQIAALLLRVYQLKKYSLSPLVGLVTYDPKMVDFFALNRVELFNKKKEKAQAVIHHYGGLINQCQVDREEGNIG